MRTTQIIATIESRMNRGVGSPLQIAIVALALVSLGGCGSADTRADEQLVRSTTHNFLAALARGDGAAACAEVTRAGQSRIAAEAGALSSNCPQAISLAARNLPARVKRALLTARVGHVLVRGDKASVLDRNLTSSQGDLRPYLKSGGNATELVKIAGLWKLLG